MRGYHVYKDIWEAPIAELLACRKEEGNVHDPYCVAVIDWHEVYLKDGHALPQVSACDTLTKPVTGVKECAL